ncbi:hypothetical protein LTS10_002661 [Elasticomyces elasticus]|nr:hypothetical protein LTS10_002661 [Elasticomyces elasticus]
MSRSGDDLNVSDIIEPQLRPIETLGSVRLQQANTGVTLLIPQPSDDPNDPLRWSYAFRIYLVTLTCTALLWVNFFAAGPAVTLVEVVVDLFDAVPPDPRNPASFSPTSIAKFSAGITKAAFLFSSASLAASTSNILWVPLAIKYGRRVVYTSSFFVFGLCCIWSARATTYESLLAARLVGAWFSGGAECVAPMTIADTFFLHERGRMMALYSASLSAGAALGAVLAGALSITQTWRTFYYLNAGLVLATTALIFFTMPETAFQRGPSGPAESSLSEQAEKAGGTTTLEYVATPHSPHKQSYLQRMAFSRTAITRESLWRIAVRPLPMIVLPPVIYATVNFGLAIGIFVVLSTTAPTAYQTIYGFTTWQVGLIWIAAILGNVVGIPFGGQFSDWIANRATRKNDGIREPEMRLPAMTLAMIAYPGSLLLFGLGLHYKTHWIVPTLGIFLFSFGSSASIGIGVVYTVDCYRPIAGEVVVAQIFYKSAITYLLGFYANPWMEKDGYAGAFGTMAAICFVGVGLWIPLYIWGGRIRRAAFKWRAMALVHWDADRDVGE